MRETKRVPLSLWGHSEKMAAMNQEAGSCQAPWSCTSQPPELWEMDVCCLQATQSTAFCYSNLNGVRQYLTHHDLLLLSFSLYMEKKDVVSPESLFSQLHSPQGYWLSISVYCCQRRTLAWFVPWSTIQYFLTGISMIYSVRVYFWRTCSGIWKFLWIYFSLDMKK